MPKVKGARVTTWNHPPRVGTPIILSRSKSGRPTARKFKTSWRPPPSPRPESTVPSILPELHPDEPPSNDEADSQPLPSTRKGPSRSVSTKLKEWLPQKQEYLEELLRLEVVGARPLQCAECQSPALFRCTDCFGLDLLCQACLLAAHARHPFHRVEKWNGQEFQKESLGNLGLVLQLGHSTRESCPRPFCTYKLTAFDTTGVHKIVVRYCMCSPMDAGSRRQQLLGSMLFPATLLQPRTVFSFRVLDYFHQLQSHNNTALFNFYNFIVRLGNNAGPSPEVYRYNEISLVYRMWVQLQEQISGTTKDSLDSTRDESSPLADRANA